MPLTSPQKASLALRIAIARFLDDDAAVPSVPGQTDALNQAKARISLRIAESTGVTTSEAIKQHLHKAAGDLEAWIVTKSDIPRDRIEAAICAIKSVAGGVQDDDGDGRAHSLGDGYCACQCGFMTVAQLVEEHALTRYLTVANTATSWPEIVYETKLTPDTLKELGTFKVGGGADIASPTRKVSLIVKDVDLSAVDLCHVFYVLFHEVVCHGFQGAARPEAVKNCKPQCHWTEGWMDTVAYKMAIRAAEHDGSAQEWLPMTGPDAVAAMTEVHDARYRDPLGLKLEDVKQRRAARIALLELRKAFRETGLAQSEADADELTYRFSLLANSNAEAKSLNRLSSFLQNVLLSKNREKDRVYAADACLEFVQHNRGLDWLSTKLQTLPQGIPQLGVAP